MLILHCVELPGWYSRFRSSNEWSEFPPDHVQQSAGLKCFNKENFPRFLFCFLSDLMNVSERYSRLFIRGWTTNRRWNVLAAFNLDKVSPANDPNLNTLNTLIQYLAIHATGEPRRDGCFLAIAAAWQLLRTRGMLRNLDSMWSSDSWDEETKRSKYVKWWKWHESFSSGSQSFSTKGHEWRQAKRQCEMSLQRIKSHCFELVKTRL